jgi:hypothetical protein
VDVPVKNENRELILTEVAIENEEKKYRFMSVEERYTFFKRKVEEANKIL